MKPKILAISAAMLLCLGASSAALAWHGGHGHGGWQRVAPQPG